MSAVTIEELRSTYDLYHQVHLGDSQGLPTLHALVVHGNQHTEVHLSERSANQALLVLELLRRMAVERKLTVMLVVPFTKTNGDYDEYGFVKSKRGWYAVC